MAIAFDLDMDENASELHIGQELSRERLRRNLSLADVSAKILISTDYLGAIERLDKDALPSSGYGVGFVRSYAQFLGLDVNQALARYKQDSEIPRDLGMRDAPHFIERRQINLPRGSIAAVLIAASFVMMATWYGMSTEAESAAVPVEPIAITEQIAVAPSEPTLNDPDMISVKAIGPSWVEIRDSEGQILISRIFVPGEVYEARKDAGLTLSARDGGALQIYRAGRLEGLLSPKGESLRSLPLQ